jgi:ABC-type sulfate transport system permease subunit
VDRTRIFAIISMPFSVVVLIFAGLLLALSFGYRQFFGRGYSKN